MMTNNGSFLHGCEGAAYARLHAPEWVNPFLSRAKCFYNLVTPGWNTSTCGGGMRWGPFNKYKNSVTTELFIATSVGMYEAFGKQSYLDSAIKAWVWFKNSGLINAQGLINDGLTDTCQYVPCEAGLIVEIMDRRPGLIIRGLYCLDCPSYTSTREMNP